MTKEIVSQQQIKSALRLIELAVLDQRAIIEHGNELGVGNVDKPELLGISLRALGERSIQRLDQALGKLGETLTGYADEIAQRDAGIERTEEVA